MGQLPSSHSWENKNYFQRNTTGIWTLDVSVFPIMFQNLRCGPTGVCSCCKILTHTHTHTLVMLHFPRCVYFLLLNLESIVSQELHSLSPEMCLRTSRFQRGWVKCGRHISVECIQLYNWLSHFPYYRCYQPSILRQLLNGESHEWKQIIQTFAWLMTMLSSCVILWRL